MSKYVKKVFIKTYVVKLYGSKLPKWVLLFSLTKGLVGIAWFAQKQTHILNEAFTINNLKFMNKITCGYITVNCSLLSHVTSKWLKTKYL